MSVKYWAVSALPAVELDTVEATDAAPCIAVPLKWPAPDAIREITAASKLALITEPIAHTRNP